MSSKSLSRQRLNVSQLSVLVLLSLAATSFGRPGFFAVGSTPYDRQMTRVQPVLNTAEAGAVHELSVITVNEWMSAIRSIPYRYSRQWQTPNEVSSMRTADCKGKAVFLYKKMRRLGATDVRLVIGRHVSSDWFTHAWLEWDTEQGSYVLDPTFHRQAMRIEQQGRNRYVPLYAYDGESRYRAMPDTQGRSAVRMVATNKRPWRLRVSSFATASFSGLN